MMIYFWKCIFKKKKKKENKVKSGVWYMPEILALSEAEEGVLEVSVHLA